MSLQSPLVIVVMGVAGSGKTSVGRRLAANLGWQFHDADDDHPAANRAKMSRGEPLTDADRRPWLELLAGRIRGWLSAETPTVLACSALTAAARQTLSQGDSRVRFVFLRGSYELILERVKQRLGHSFPPELLASQFDALEEPDPTQAMWIDLDRGGDVDAIAQEIQRRVSR